jgi:hypothetical protein
MYLASTHLEIRPVERGNAPEAMDDAVEPGEDFGHGVPGSSST